jgi:hypothetical protein
MDRLPECVRVSSFEEALGSINGGEDAVVFEEKECFYVNNIGVLGRDRDDRLFHDYVIPRRADAAADIRCNLPFDILVNGRAVSDVDCILFCVAPYTEFQIRFSIDPALNTISLRYNTILFSHGYRKQLLTSELHIGGISYKNGECKVHQSKK